MQAVSATEHQVSYRNDTGEYSNVSHALKWGTSAE